VKELYTIGHSNHSVETFVDLLLRHRVSAVADVRSSPFSRFNPQYNRENLKPALLRAGIAYVYLGNALGPRSDDPACYENGRVSYERLAETPLFRAGLKRLREGAERQRIAIMCAEKDPIVCHRMILICRALRSESIDIRHILEDGSLESLEAAEKRLLVKLKMHQLSLFDRSVEDLFLRAYRKQAEKIAYRADDEDADQEEAEEEHTVWQPVERP